MNTDDMQPDQESSSTFRFKAALIGVGLLVAGLFVYLQLSSGPRGGSSTGPVAETERGQNPREAAVEMLQREKHLAACGNALTLLNKSLASEQRQQVAALPASARSWLQQTAKLTPDELGEIEQTTFTALDGPYLESCFLLRDAARQLEAWPATATASERPDPVERARAAFAWVVRQVQLSEAPPRSFNHAFMLPPQMALRVGGETCWDRALVFLALLEQMGVEEAPPPDLLGCLVAYPDRRGVLQLWACGVLIGREVYLFDPELGLPLPAPDGKGIATLAAARKDPKKLLDQLNVSEKTHYDVTPEQVAQARVYLAPSLSSLAPRMRLLQDELLISLARMRLAHDAQKDRARFQAANGVGKDAVELLAPAMTVLRHYLSPTEGGTDGGQMMLARQIPRVTGFASERDSSRLPMNYQFYTRLQLTPWKYFPREIRESELLPATSELGQSLRARFEAPFVQSALEPGHARDLMLRGNLNRAVNELTEERDKLEGWRQRLRLRSSRSLEEEASRWLKDVARARYVLRNQKGSAADQAKAQREWDEMFKKAEPVIILLEGAVAEPRLAQVNYLLAQCKMEQAESLQARLEYNQRSGMKPGKEEQEEVESAWNTALFLWRKYLEDYSRSAYAPRARMHKARTLVLLGNQAEAIKELRDLRGIRRAPEAIAHLYLAKQLEKK